MYDIELSCIEFTEKLSSKSPTPGGGGAAALAGAVGAALCSMVGNLTIGKKKYAAVESEIIELTDRVNGYRRELLELVGKDAEVFEPLSKAYSLPKETEEEKARKDMIMEKCLNDACSVPVRIMEVCCEAIELVNEFAEKGSVLAVSDAACAASLLRSALQCASLNVYINTKSMKNRETADKINRYAGDMLAKYVPAAEAVFEKVSLKLMS
ncbi:MAG TPA: cyclodeaminase/cyclohydrolase family protein [Candidatus Alectryocaccobium stercorigallinarum]|jgi:formiminotetrahydrofolate cyclodeaminase|nr:cyclodeaminase/cyclohydrolase family protein [Candidatus Alectryocaccobium stercorigallinarum]